MGVHDSLENAQKPNSPAPPGAAVVATGVVVTIKQQGASGLAVIALAILFSGCSVSVSTGDSQGLSADTLEAELGDEAAAQMGDPLDAINCTNGLDAEVDDATTCSVTEKGVIAIWDVKVTDVDEDNDSIDFSWQVQDGSQRLLASSVADSIGPEFGRQTGYTLTALNCPQEEISAQPGTTVTCEASTAEGRTGPVRLKMDGAEGMVVNFSWDLPEAEQ